MARSMGRPLQLTQVKLSVRTYVHRDGWNQDVSITMELFSWCWVLPTSLYFLYILARGHWTQSWWRMEYVLRFEKWEIYRKGRGTCHQLLHRWNQRSYNSVSKENSSPCLSYVNDIMTSFVLINLLLFYIRKVYFAYTKRSLPRVKSKPNCELWSEFSVKKKRIVSKWEVFSLLNIFCSLMSEKQDPFD